MIYSQNARANYKHGAEVINTNIDKLEVWGKNRSHVEGIFTARAVITPQNQASKTQCPRGEGLARKCHIVQRDGLSLTRPSR